MSEVKTLHLEGKLRMADNPRTPYIGEDEPVWKNRDVLDELRGVAGYKDTACAIQIRFPESELDAEGDLALDTGATHYSTVTPGAPSKFCVGDQDIIKFLARYTDQNVVIDIAIPIPVGDAA